MIRLERDMVKKEFIKLKIADSLLLLYGSNFESRHMTMSFFEADVKRTSLGSNKEIEKQPTYTLNVGNPERYSESRILP